MVIYHHRLRNTPSKGSSTRWITRSPFSADFMLAGKANLRTATRPAGIGSRSGGAPKRQGVYLGEGRHKVSALVKISDIVISRGIRAHASGRRLDDHHPVPSQEHGDGAPVERTEDSCITLRQAPSRITRRAFGVNRRQFQESIAGNEHTGRRNGHQVSPAVGQNDELSEYERVRSSIRISGALHLSRRGRRVAEQRRRAFETGRHNRSRTTPKTHLHQVRRRIPRRRARSRMAGKLGKFFRENLLFCNNKIFVKREPSRETRFAGRQSVK